MIDDFFEDLYTPLENVSIAEHVFLMVLSGSHLQFL
jgi:hypothetical protein